MSRGVAGPVADPRALAAMRLWSAYVSWVLTAGGVDHLLIKGVAWSGPLARDVVPVDVDVLVAPGAFDAALAVLRTAGLVSALDVRDDEAALHSTTLRLPDGPEVDVHRSFPGLDVDVAAFWSWAWSSRTVVELGHRAVPVPGADVQVALALAGAARDGAGSSSAQRVGQALPTLDWSTLLPALRAVEALGTARAGLLAAGQGALADTLGLPAVPFRFRAHASAGESRLEEVLAQPWRRRVSVAARELWPTAGFLARNAPGVPTGRARMRHLMRVGRQLPGAVLRMSGRRLRG